MTRRGWWVVAGMQAVLLAVGGAPALADDVPLPASAEGVTRHEGRMHTVGVTTTLFQTNDTPSEVMAFYRETLVPQQWQPIAVPGIEQVAGGQLQVARYLRDEHQMIINAQRQPGQSVTAVTVSLVRGKTDELIKRMQTGGNVAMQVDGTTVQWGSGGQAARDVLGVPAYPGAQLIGDMHQPEFGSMEMAIYGTNSEAADVAEFYRNTMPLHGWRKAARRMDDIKQALDAQMQPIGIGSDAVLLYETNDQMAMITLQPLPAGAPGGARLGIGVSVTKHPQRELQEAHDALRR